MKNEPRIKRGCKAKHPIYGEGTVEFCSDTYVLIQFGKSRIAFSYDEIFKEKKVQIIQFDKKNLSKIKKRRNTRKLKQKSEIKYCIDSVENLTFYEIGSRITHEEYDSGIIVSMNEKFIEVYFDSIGYLNIKFPLYFIQDKRKVEKKRSSIYDSSKYDFIENHIDSSSRGSTIKNVNLEDRENCIFVDRNYHILQKEIKAENKEKSCNRCLHLIRQQCDGMRPAKDCVEYSEAGPDSGKWT